MVAISGDAAAADELEKCLDGTGGTLTATLVGNLAGNVTGTVSEVTTVHSVQNGVTLANGAIGQATFQTDAIRAAALAADAVGEIQAGLATLAGQAAIAAYVDELESRLTAARAANLDRLDVAVSTRLAGASYVAPDNTAVGAILAVLEGITSLADWLRAIIRSDTADLAARAEINAAGGVYDESRHSLMSTASLAELLEADRYIDTSVDAVGAGA